MREAAKKKKKWASTALALALFGLLPLALRVAAAPEEIRCEYTGNLTLAAYDFTQEPPTALIRYQLPMDISDQELTAVSEYAVGGKEEEWRKICADYAPAPHPQQAAILACVRSLQDQFRDALYAACTGESKRNQVGYILAMFLGHDSNLALMRGDGRVIEALELDRLTEQRFYSPAVKFIEDESFICYVSLELNNS